MIKRRTPQKANLSGLYAVNSDIAHDKNKKFKSGVYGVAANYKKECSKRVLFFCSNYQKYTQNDFEHGCYKYCNSPVQELLGNNFIIQKQIALSIKI